MSSLPFRGLASAGDWSVEDAFGNTKTTVLGVVEWGRTKSMSLWGKTTRRMRTVGAVVIFTLISLTLWRPDQQYDMPKVSFDYGVPKTPFNVSKVALLIENRANPILAPLVLHFMAVVPPDWRFRFLGSPDSVSFLNTSQAIRDQVRIGKLDLDLIPSNMSTAGQEQISRFLTNLWIYETVLAPAEWLLVFQTDSMLCANSRQSLNEWLDYDWVGAPWNPTGRFGGNGGLSMRRVSAIIDVLRNQQRVENSQPEDVWLTERLGHRPGAKLANGTASLTFSGEMFSGEQEKVAHEKTNGEGTYQKKPAADGINSIPQDEGWVQGIDDWRDGFYEPMGYHTGDSGNTLHGGIWGTPELRHHIWDYCPEVKLIFDMDAAEYVPGTCNSNWKRGIEGTELGPMDVGSWKRGLELDEEGYPYFPANLMPW